MCPARAARSHSDGLDQESDLVGQRCTMDCVFYSEFDNEAGPVLRYQAPRGCEASPFCSVLRRIGLPAEMPQHLPSFITPDQFDSISQYLITKQRFCGRLITLCAARPAPAQHLAGTSSAVWLAYHRLLLQSCARLVQWKPRWRAL